MTYQWLSRLHRSLYTRRTMVALSIVAKLRASSDRGVIESVKENRYIQYFCHVPDQGLMTFLHPSTLCKFRKRLGEKGSAVIEETVFNHLKDAQAIKADMMLQDATVLESPIIYHHRLENIPISPV